MWELRYTKQAIKDSYRIKEAGFKDKVIVLLDILGKDRFKIHHHTKS